MLIFQGRKAFYTWMTSKLNTIFKFNTLSRLIPVSVRGKINKYLSKIYRNENLIQLQSLL